MTMFETVDSIKLAGECVEKILWKTPEQVAMIQKIINMAIAPVAKGEMNIKGGQWE